MSEDDSTASSAPSSTSLGRIGPYKLLGVLGEGGMGIVYLAEQEGALRRRVAVKVIKPGMDSKQVLARFESERQALALLNHPNIARVFDAGTTDQGRPYFVMEHVAGVPITEYCDRHLLTNKERLALFLPVCQAIEHAHRRGILHRDIKPSNVIVAEEDAKPIPKVIDFGVAKATSQPLTERTLFTEQGALIGTPEYMSPEQAEMSAEGIDVRADVYSLGVLLYELLVGAPPLDAKTIRRAGYAEMQRVIREVEPPTPSEKIRRMGIAAADVSRKRQRDVRTLCRDLRGDLDAIVLKALQKDRKQRYVSAAEFETDLSRYLQGEKVLARQVGLGDWRTLRPVLGPALLAALFGLLLANLSLGQALERRGLDLLFRLRGVRPPPSEVCVVAIDEASYTALDLDRRASIPRALQARLVRALEKAGARVIAYDVLFTDPTSLDDDRAFAAAVEQAGNVVLGMTMASPEHGVQPYPAFGAAAAAVGEVGLSVNRDGVIRATRFRQENIQSFSAAAYRLGTGLTPPQDMILIDYYGPAGTIQTVSLYEALEPSKYLPENFFRGRIVFVGLAFPPGVWGSPSGDGSEAKIVFRTPFGDAQTGVEIHATVAANLLEGRHLRPLSPPVESAVLLLFPLVGGALFLGGRLLRATMLLLALQALAWIGAGLLFARAGLWSPVMLVSVVQLPLIYLAGVARALRRRRRRA